MESPKEQEELGQIGQWLQAEGLAPGASLEEQLRFLWQEFQHSEGRLVTVTHDLKSLHARNATEVNEIQRYLEHLRSLSEQRDALAQEYEQDNEDLRAQLHHMTLQQEAQLNEVAEMLYQEGLADVIPSSPSEQVAYLLVERATMMRPDPETAASQTEAEAAAPSASRPGAHAQPRGSGEGAESLHKGAPSRGLSPWKRLFGLRKAAESKQAFVSAAVRGQGSGVSVERQWACLERDLEEASRRLDMAHKEIRRLTDELESARMTQLTYEPELQSAQQEVEQLRQEVEKLKNCDVVELRKAKELNDRLDQEIRALRTRVRSMDAQNRSLMETIENIKDTPDKGAEVRPEALQHNGAKGEGPRIHTLSLQTDPKLQDRCPPESEVLVKQLAEAQQQLQELQMKISDDQDLKVRLGASQEECERLSEELKEALISLDTLSSKYAKEYSKQKTKLKQVKQTFVQETEWRTDKIKDLERELALALASLEKERDMVLTVCEANKELQEDKRGLLQQVINEEEKTYDSVLAAKLSRQRGDYLEEESSQQHHRIMTMSNQIVALKRTLRDLHPMCRPEEGDMILTVCEANKELQEDKRGLLQQLINEEGDTAMAV